MFWARVNNEPAMIDDALVPNPIIKLPRTRKARLDRTIQTSNCKTLVDAFMVAKRVRNASPTSIPSDTAAFTDRIYPALEIGHSSRLETY
jgi:hypothetical protein